MDWRYQDERAKRKERETYVFVVIGTQDLFISFKILKVHLYICSGLGFGFFILIFVDIFSLASVSSSLYSSVFSPIFFITLHNLFSLLRFLSSSIFRSFSSLDTAFLK